MSAMPHGESGSAQKKFKSRSKKMRTRKKNSLDAVGRMTNCIKGISNFYLSGAYLFTRKRSSPVVRKLIT